MFLYVTDHDLLDKKLEDAWGNVHFTCKTHKIFSSPDEDQQHYTVLTNALGETYGRVNWQGQKPTRVWLREHTYESMRDFFGKCKTQGRKIIYDSSARRLKWIIDPNNVVLETNNRGKMTPLLGYTIYRPGEGGNFADALTLADDLYGLSIAEVLVGWLILERIRTFQWESAELESHMPPHEKMGNTTCDRNFFTSFFAGPPSPRRPTRKLHKKCRPEHSQPTRLGPTFDFSK